MRERKVDFRKVAIMTIGSIIGIIIFVFILFPLVWLFVTSLKDISEVYNVPPRWIPKNPTLALYKEVFSSHAGRQSSWPVYYLNSVLVAGAATAITVVLASLAGYGFARLKLRFAAPLLVVMLVTQMFPGPSLLIPIFLTIRSMGLFNTLYGLILLHAAFALPFTTWMGTNMFRSIPPQIEEAAIVDGCSRFRVFLRITLPLSKMGLVTTGMFAFLLSWSEFPFALVLLQKEKMFTVPVGLSRYLTAHDIAWNEIAAVTVFMAVPLLIVFLILQKSFVKGMIAGYGKG